LLLLLLLLVGMHSKQELQVLQCSRVRRKRARHGLRLLLLLLRAWLRLVCITRRGTLLLLLRRPLLLWLLLQRRPCFATNTFAGCCLGNSSGGRRHVLRGPCCRCRMPLLQEHELLPQRCRDQVARCCCRCCHRVAASRPRSGCWHNTRLRKARGCACRHDAAAQRAPVQRHVPRATAAAAAAGVRGCRDRLLPLVQEHRQRDGCGCCLGACRCCCLARAAQRQLRPVLQHRVKEAVHEEVWRQA
jgi:hypothetical protein